MNTGKDWRISREYASSTKKHPKKISRTNLQQYSLRQTRQRPIRITNCPRNHSNLTTTTVSTATKNRKVKSLGGFPPRAPPAENKLPLPDLYGSKGRWTPTKRNCQPGAPIFAGNVIGRRSISIQHRNRSAKFVKRLDISLESAKVRP